MKKGLNKVQIIGNLGRDPDVRHMPNGDAVTKIAVATSESWKDRASGEQQEKTEWHNIVMFRQLGEIAGKYLKKGAKVYIEGQLRTRKWEKDGQTHYSTEIVADEMQMLDSRQSVQSPGSQQQQGQQRQQAAPQQQATQQQGQQQRQQNQSQASPAPQGGQGGFDDFDDDIPF